MNFSSLGVIFFLVLFLSLIFFYFGYVSNDNFFSLSSFECGFSSYFFSRFSFSVHFFLVGLVFLFLDLELSFVLPYFILDFSSFNFFNIFLFFIFLLLFGLFFEWKEGNLDWKFLAHFSHLQWVC